MAFSAGVHSWVCAEQTSLPLSQQRYREASKRLGEILGEKQRWLTVIVQARDNAGWTELRRSRAVGVIAKYKMKLVFFFTFFIRWWRNLQWKCKNVFFFFLLSTLICRTFAFSGSLVWRWEKSAIYFFNICDGNSCLDSKVECRRRSEVVTHPVSVICSSINPSVTLSLRHSSNWMRPINTNQFQLSLP